MEGLWVEAGVVVEVVVEGEIFEEERCSALMGEWWGFDT